MDSYKAVVIYARLSYNPDGTKMSVARQLETCRAVAAKHSWQVTAEYTDDGKSGWDEGVYRKGWEHMLSALEAGNHDAVLAVVTDRLSRNSRDGARLLSVGKSRGIALLVANGSSRDLRNADARMMFAIENAVDTRYSDGVSEKVRPRMAELRKQGVVYKPGFGWQRSEDGTAVIDPDEAKVIREMAERLLVGETWVTILGDLMERGVRTKTGKVIGNTHARRILLAPRCAGLIDHKGEIVGAFRGEAPLDEPTWRAVQTLLITRKPAQGPPRKHLLSGLLQCGKCGSDMCGGVQPPQGNRIARARYICFGGVTGATKCGNSIKAAPVDELVIEAVLAWQVVNRAALAAETGFADEASARAKAKIKSQQEASSVLFERWQAGAMTREQFDEHCAVVDAQLTEAKKELAAAKVPATARRLTVEREAKAFCALTLPEQRAEIALAVVLPVVLGAATRRGVVDLDRVKIEPRKVTARGVARSRPARPAAKAG